MLPFIISHARYIVAPFIPIYAKSRSLLALYIAQGINAYMFMKKHAHVVYVTLGMFYERALRKRREWCLASL